MKENKSNSRSLRYTETVRKYIEQQPGIGFNEQFENLVLHCIADEQALDLRMFLKQSQLIDLEVKISNMQTIQRTLSDCTFGLRCLQEELRKALDLGPKDK